MCVYTAEHAPCEHVECKSRHHGVGCVSVKLGFKQTMGKGGNTSPVLTGIAVV